MLHPIGGTAAPVKRTFAPARQTSYCATQYRTVNFAREPTGGCGAVFSPMYSCLVGPVPVFHRQTSEVVSYASHPAVIFRRPGAVTSNGFARVPGKQAP